jgi:hypothetical protein
LLSIVVEAYLRVKRAIEDQETEQNFILDMGAVVSRMLKSRVDQWPKTAEVCEILSKYKSLRTIDIETLGQCGKDWDRSSRIRFMRHYERYDFLVAKKVEENIQTFDHAVESMERRVAAVVGQPVPTLHERMASASNSKKKPPEKFDVRFGRIEKYLEWLLRHNGASTLVLDELYGENEKTRVTRIGNAASTTPTYVTTSGHYDPALPDKTQSGEAPATMITRSHLIV